MCTLYRWPSRLAQALTARGSRVAEERSTTAATAMWCERNDSTTAAGQCRSQVVAGLVLVYFENVPLIALERYCHPDHTCIYIILLDLLCAMHDNGKRKGTPLWGTHRLKVLKHYGLRL